MVNWKSAIIKPLSIANNENGQMAIGSYSSNHYTLFDNELTNAASTGAGINTTGGNYLGIKLSKNTKIERIDYVASAFGCPINFEIQGSNDGSNWDNIYNATNLPYLANGESNSIEFVNNSEYLYYRLYQSTYNSNNYGSSELSSGNRMEVRELDMFFKDYSNKFLILSNDGKAIRIDSNNPNQDTVPTMTSNTAPSGIASASGATSSTYEAWKAFDKSDSSYGWMISGVTGWLSYKFPIEKRIIKYSIKCSPTTPIARMPKDWTFEGSNDGTTWTVLDTQTNQINWIDGQVREYNIINANSYIQYRINITNSNNTSYTTIGELAMFEASIGKITKLNSQSEQNFINYGMDKSTQIDLNLPITNKVFIEQSPTTLGSGKVFSKSIDTTKTPIKKVSIK